MSCPSTVVEVGADVGGRGVAHHGGEDVGQVLLEPVPGVPVDPGPAGVVGNEAVEGPVVGDADEQGSALPGVQEGGDGFE